MYIKYINWSVLESRLRYEIYLKVWNNDFTIEQGKDTKWNFVVIRWVKDTYCLDQIIESITPYARVLDFWKELSENHYKSYSDTINYDLLPLWKHPWVFQNWLLIQRTYYWKYNPDLDYREDPIIVEKNKYIFQWWSFHIKKEYIFWMLSNWSYSQPKIKTKVYYSDWANSEALQRRENVISHIKDPVVSWLMYNWYSLESAIINAWSLVTKYSSNIVEYKEWVIEPLIQAITDDMEISRLDVNMIIIDKTFRQYILDEISYTPPTNWYVWYQHDT